MYVCVCVHCKFPLVIFTVVPYGDSEGHMGAASLTSSAPVFVMELHQGICQHLQ